MSCGPVFFHTRRAVDRVGHTLTELLVSIGILALIGVVLVGVLKTGLDMWDRGESRRDGTERAQIVLGEMAQELPRMFCELDERPPSATPVPLSRVIDREDAVSKGNPGRPGLFCVFDASGQQRLRFSRPAPAPTPAPAGSDTGGSGSDAPAPGNEPVASFGEWADDLRSFADVAYLLQPGTNGGEDLWRVYLPGPVVGEDPFPEAQFSPDALKQSGDLVVSGILYLRYRFWSHMTNTWDTGIRPGSDAGSGGPEVIWDSTRQVIPEFAFHREKVARIGPSSDVLPLMVQVELAIRPDSHKKTWGALREDLATGATLIEVDSTQGFPDPPGLLRVDNEWIEYKERNRSSFVVGRRGVRETQVQPHKKEARVYWGETFLITLTVRNYRVPRDPALPPTAGGKK